MQTATAERFHGRRHGRRLRPGRQRLLDSLLPRLAVRLPAAGGSLDPAALFARPVGDVWLEIGFGAGEHLAAQALRHPELGFIGCEPYVNGVAALLARLEAGGIGNARIFADDARTLLPHLTGASLGRIYVLFADPWPKARHHGRRFIQPETLDALARLLKDGGELRFASDDIDYVRWTIACALAHPAFVWTWECGRDWHRPPADWLPTRYETKALAAGGRCIYLSFRRRSRLLISPAA